MKEGLRVELAFAWLVRVYRTCAAPQPRCNCGRVRALPAEPGGHALSGGRQVPEVQISRGRACVLPLLPEREAGIFLDAELERG